VLSVVYAELCRCCCKESRRPVLSHLTSPHLIYRVHLPWPKSKCLRGALRSPCRRRRRRSCGSGRARLGGGRVSVGGLWELTPLSCSSRHRRTDGRTVVLAVDTHCCSHPCVACIDHTLTQSAQSLIPPPPPPPWNRFSGAVRASSMQSVKLYISMQWPSQTSTLHAPTPAASRSTRISSRTADSLTTRASAGHET